MVNENNSTKEKVLNVLKRNDGPVSGSDLSLLLKVSRTSVWKAVQSLQNSGYKIIAEKKATGLKI
ncbi:MAG: helix-turn-helix domain-containing protein [Treponema sp.]|nr:helix-turn-helix domain-containing protein [Treponema sp.]